MQYSTIQPMVVWVGGLDSWDPLMKGSVVKGVHLESQTTNPNRPPIYH